MNSAVFSPEQPPLYRYRLDRALGLFDGPIVGFMLHNASSAGAEKNDPTVRRGIGFATRFGAKRLIHLNPWAGIATDADDLWRMADPVGPQNDFYIADAAAEIVASGGFVVVGWGVVSPPPILRAAARARLDDVQRNVAALGCPMFALGINSDGSPRHPLYVKADTPLVRFDGRRAA